MQIIIIIFIIIISTVAQRPNIEPWPSVLHVPRYVKFYGEELMAPLPTPKLKNQVSLFVTPGERVAHCSPRHWVARNLGLATSGTYSNCEPFRRGARCLYVSPR